MIRRIVGGLVTAGVIATAIAIPVALDNDGYEEPEAAFSAYPLNGIEPLEVSFTDESTGAVAFWEWDFNNDGIIDSTEQHPTYVYSSPGEYTVSLTVGDVTMSTETKIAYISVSPEEIRNIDISRDEDFKDNEESDVDSILPPEFNPTEADFSASPKAGNAPLTVRFTDYSTGDIIYREWDFDGDGNADSTERNPSYTYNDAAVYQVSLLIRDNTAIAKTKTDIITVVNPPQADFTATPTWGYCGVQVQFTDTSTGNVTYWKWDFNGDGVIDSTEQHPVWTYLEVGEYTVILTSGNITSSTVTKTNYIEVLEGEPVEEGGDGGGEEGGGEGGEGGEGGGVEPVE